MSQAGANSSSGGGGGSGILTINSITPTGGGNFTLESTDGSITFTDITNGLNLSATGGDLYITPYIVDNVLPAPYTTIQSAINAAAAAGGGTVAIRYGTYVENPIMAAGVNLVGFSGLNINPNTIINGNVTASYTGAATITNISILENVGSPLITTGTNSTFLFLNNVAITSTNSQCVASSNANSVIVSESSLFIQNGANPYFAIVGGTFINNNGIYSDGGSSTANTVVGGEFQQYGGFGSTSFVVSGGGDLNAENFTFNTQNGSCITIDDTSSCKTIFCDLHAQDGASSAVVIATSNGSYNTSFCTINSGATYAISGLGSLQYDHLSLPNTVALDPGLNLSIDTTLPISQAVSSPGTAAAGHCYFNSAQFSVDPTGYVSSTGSSGITINGDTGSITGPILTIFADQVSANCGSTVLFSNSGTTSTLNVTDGNGNTIVGLGSGSGPFSGGQSVAFGSGNLTAGASTSSGLCVVGNNSLTNSTNGHNHLALGNDVLQSLAAGASVIAIGQGSGAAYTTTESSNIVINHSGVIGDANTIRIGEQGSGTGQQNTCFVAGIIGVSPSNPVPVVIDSSTGQLGVGSSTPLAANYTAVNFSMSPYTVLSTDYYISVDSSGGAVTLLMPATPTFKQVWIIKDRTGNASTNNITINGNGNLIDDASSYTIVSNFGSIQTLANSNPSYEVF